MAIYEDTRGRVWRTASRCSPNGCVSVAQDADGTILVRDTKDPEGAALRYFPHEWELFVTAVKDGEFDLFATRAAAPSGGEAGGEHVRHLPDHCH